MCGITGYISPKSWNGKAMLQSLHHRGPDTQQGYSTQVVDLKLFQGHTRLSIIDLSVGGSQPMFSDDEQIVITYNGEIYNHLELKEQYLKGEYFKSTSDTEVLLKLYQKKGIGCLSLLNGDFAICIHDKNTNKVYLVRDRLGVKPLYFYWQNETLIYASEIKSILAAGITAELNKEAVQRFFVYKYSPEQETLFKNINRVDPAHYLEYELSSKSITAHRYWELPPQDSKMPYGEAKEELEMLIADATKIRLMADVPVGSFLSGGIDSSILAYYMRDHKEILHFCASKNEEDLKKEGSSSDYQYARRLADEWKLHLEQIHIGSEELNKKQLDKVLHFGDDLIADGSQIPSYLITQQAAKKIKVILTGMGADEIFYGYAGHQLAYLAQYFNKIPGVLRKPILKTFENLNTGSGRFKPYKRYLYKFGKNFKYGHLQYGTYSIVGDFENSMSIYRGNDNDTMGILGKYFQPNRDPFASQTQFEVNNFLVKNLHYVDRMSMANSVESRVPFLDHRLVEFAVGLPRKYKLGANLLTKKILKEAYQNILPDYIIKRRKAGFGMPLRSILSDRKKVDSLLDVDFFGDFEGFSMPDIQRIKGEHFNGVGDNSSIIFALISFQNWHQKYLG